MFRTTILSLTAAFAVAAISTSSDAQPYPKPYRWYGKPVTVAKLKSPRTQFVTCGRGMRLGGDKNCYPILN